MIILVIVGFINVAIIALVISAAIKPFDNQLKNRQKGR